MMNEEFDPSTSDQMRASLYLSHELEINLNTRQCSDSRVIEKDAASESYAAARLAMSKCPESHEVVVKC